MTSPTTIKGNIGQTAAALDALRRGYHVSIPMEGAAYDLIVDTGSALLRVQVKYVEPKNGILLVRLRESTSEKVDYFAVYNCSDQKIYWIPFNKITNELSMALRVDESKQKRSDALYASDFVSL